MLNDFRMLTIVGAGASGREIAWLAREIYSNAIELQFAVEPAYLTATEVGGIPVRSLDASIRREDSRYVIAVGDSAARRRLSSICDALGMIAATLIHPRVERSADVRLGGGCIVAAGAVLTTNVTLGRHVHVNIGCTVSHDVVLDDFVTLSPGVHLSGHVHVACGAFLGTGANVVNGTLGVPLVIGADSIVAAGACVTRPVEPGAMVAGVPATRRR